MGSESIDFRTAEWFIARKRAVNMPDLFWLTDAQISCFEWDYLYQS